MALNPDDFGASFTDFIEQMRSQKKPGESPFFVRKLRDHFGTEPAKLPIVSQPVLAHEHPNLHAAIEKYLSDGNRSVEILGVVGLSGFMGKGLAELVAPKSGFGGAANQGPVEYANIELDGDNVVACVERGLFLIKDGEERLVIFVRQDDRIGSRENLTVEVMAPERSAAERLLRDLREAMRVCNVYRGHVISLSNEGLRDVVVKFHRLPEIERNAIILPAGLLERIERQTVGFSSHARQLLAAGRHLKRGLLLHGPPGTGKTLTIMYLVGAMRDRTALLVSGRSMAMVGRTCAMARALQPSIVVLEDVDLIAEERTKAGSGCATPLLFELLNEMDGLADDADVLFLLTSNRPDLLEPALAARPGRVDQAIEIPPPDEECRRRLFELYGRGLRIEIANLSRFIVRTEGGSAAFIRELLRRAALFAVGDGDEIVVTDKHVEEALHDLVVQGGDLTRSLLGFKTRLGFGVERQDWNQG
jgi:hypothetical protein